MDGRNLPALRAGLGTRMENNSTEQRIQFIQTSMGLLKVFSEEAVKTASDYVIAQGGEAREVGEEDMKKALMYQARMFFQSVEDLVGGPDRDRDSVDCRQGVKF